MASPAPGRSGASISATIRIASEQARTTGHGPVWLALREHDDLMTRAQKLERQASSTGAALPLRGLAFAVKDNIDVAGLPTTAGCPAFATMPRASAPVVERLEQAGAICIGKTHLDQFATGLVGTRSPLGPVPNPFCPDYVCGGSSSGSAVAVALGQVAFALGTDTAGSGRIPAAFNNVVGIKPSRGLLSTRGVLPACRSLDCVAILARDLATAWQVLQVAAWRDPDDAYSRAVRQRPVFGPVARLGVLSPLEFFGDAMAQAQFAGVRAQWQELGAELSEVPLAPFAEVSNLLYEGPWIAERDAAIGDFLKAHPDDCDPIVRAIVAGAAQYSATDAFRGRHRRRELAAQLAPLWQRVDALVAPTAPTIPTLAALAREPVAANARLGLYTNFVNLLDLAAIAVPAGFRADGLPAGFTLIAPAGSDHALAELAHRYLLRYPNRLGVHEAIGDAGPPPHALPDERGWVRLAVAGAHMRGMPLNYELLAQDARFVGAARTAPRYRLHALAGATPKPALVRAAEGACIGLELWDVPHDGFGRFTAQIPPPLAIGNVELETGGWVKGFVCEPIALVEATDITCYGDWRSYLDSGRPDLAAVN
jgi:allophanate hydrolase